MDLVNLQVGQATVRAEVARTSAEKARGLQGHAPLRAGEGMYFPLLGETTAFHMGTVDFPIDLVFARAGRIEKIVTARPGTPDRWSSPGADAVVELPGGYCQASGIAVGMPLRQARLEPPACPRCASPAPFDAAREAHLCPRCEEPSSRTANNQSRDLLRTLTEASAEEEDILTPKKTGIWGPIELAARALTSRPDFARLARDMFVFLPDGSVVLGTPEEVSEFLAEDRTARAILHLLAAADTGERPKLERAWTQIAGKLDVWERDAVVRALDGIGVRDAVGLLRIAQSDSQIDVSDAGPPPAAGPDGRTPPGDRFTDRAIPAETPGVGTEMPMPNFDQEIGYDPSVEHDDLLGGDVPAMRPSASRQAGGDMHPGDRIKITEDGDGLKKDDGGVCTDLQGDVVRVKLDGEPIARWVSDDQARQDQAKEDVLKEIDGGDDKGGGGLGSLLGG